MARPVIFSKKMHFSQLFLSTSGKKVFVNRSPRVALIFHIFLKIFNKKSPFLVFFKKGDTNPSGVLDPRFFWPNLCPLFRRWKCFVRGFIQFLKMYFFKYATWRHKKIIEPPLDGGIQEGSRRSVDRYRHFNSQPQVHLHMHPPIASEKIFFMTKLNQNDKFFKRWKICGY